MTIHFNPQDNWPQRGRAFNHSVVEPEGRRVHITGQVGWDKDGKVVGTDTGEQMECAILGIKNVLEPMGGTLADIVSMTVYFTNPADIPVIQKVRSAHFASDTAPASILIQVLGLVAPQLTVELVPIAVIPFDRFVDPT